MSTEGFGELKPGETLEDLQLKGLLLLQSRDTFRFGTDTVLLAHFAGIRKGSRVCDLGTGNGALPVLLSGLYGEHFCDALEIQPELCEIARRNVSGNGLGRIRVIQGDMMKLPIELERGSYDCVISNPPYQRIEAGENVKNELLRKARCEVCMDLPGFIGAAAYLLKEQGKLVTVYRPDRTAELLYTMHEAGIEPKRLRCVHSAESKPPMLILVQGIKHGRPGTMWEPPLILNGDTSKYE